MIRDIVLGSINYLGLLGLTALPFTLYFGLKKVGHKVAAAYQWTAGPFIASGICSVTLVNRKDRPEVIFEVYAVMDGLVFDLKEFDPPLILKALEAVSIDIKAVSERSVGEKPYDWKPPEDVHNGVLIYLSTPSKMIRCSQLHRRSRLGFAIRNKLPLVVNNTRKFNGVVYNKDVRYAVTYTEDNETKTALVSTDGHIYWTYRIMQLTPQQMQSAQTAKAALDATGIGAYIAPFEVDDLQAEKPRRGIGRKS